MCFCSLSSHYSPLSLNFFPKSLQAASAIPHGSTFSGTTVSSPSRCSSFQHKRKLNREISQHCSGKRLEWKTRDESGIRGCEEGKRELESTGGEMKIEDDVHELPGIPLVPSNLNSKPGIIFVLERASLVPAYVGRRYQILNPDEHADFLRKKNMDPYNYRPDIVHEALLQIMGSRLCMAGMVQALYVKTDEGVLIKVQPHANIPKTLGRFCAMMSELLQKFSIKAKGKHEKLLQLIKNPVTQYLPVNSCKIGLSFSSQKVVQLRDYVSAISNDVNLVFVVGAMAHGKVDSEYTDDIISVSGHPLSAGLCLRRICIALERKWKIL